MLTDINLKKIAENSVKLSFNSKIIAEYDYCTVKFDNNNQPRFYYSNYSQKIDAETEPITNFWLIKDKIWYIAILIDDLFLVFTSENVF